MTLKFSNNAQLGITNKTITDKREVVVQAICLLLQTDSPYREKVTSLSSLVGNNQSEDAEAEISERLNNVKSIISTEYDVSQIVVEDISYNNSTNKYDIEIAVAFPDGALVKETISA